MVFSGAVKIIDPRGTEYKITDYTAAFHLASLTPPPVPIVLSVLLGALEFCMGVYLLFGVRRKLTSRIVLAMMLTFTALTLYTALTGTMPDCGCFGDAVRLTPWQTFAKNILILPCAITLALWPRVQARLISITNQWIVAMYSWIYALILAIYTIYTIPLIDFRPYHIGADLKLKTTWGEDGTPPDITDLQIYEPRTYRDLTDSIINSPGWKFLIISPRLTQADDGVMDRLAELTDYCAEQGYMLVCLTQSDAYDIEQWRETTGAEYPFCTVDEVVLKTMVRSNPGLIMLDGAEIKGKWAATQLPGAQDLTGPVPSTALIAEPDTASRVPFSLLLWFILPLTVISVGDRILVGVRFYRNNRDKIINQFKNRKKMRKHIVAGNWKMNKNLQEGVALATELKEILAADQPNCDVIIGTPFIHLATVSELLKDSVIAVSAENCANKASGAYTGEVSAEMVKSTGAEYVILGHSERREYYNETPEILKEKVDLALANGLKVIFCIGESLEQREANEQEAVCKAELAGSVFHLTADQWKNIVIAYEPIWAIGTGKTATAEQAQEIHAFIRSCVAEVYGAEVAAETSILYGGSCKGSNAPELFSKEDIDGGLIGGASLKAADFKAIIDAWK